MTTPASGSARTATRTGSSTSMVSCSLASDSNVMMIIPSSSQLALQRFAVALLLGASLVMTGCAAHSPAHPHESIHRDVLFASPDGHDLHMDLYVPHIPHHDAD